MEIGRLIGIKKVEGEKQNFVRYSIPSFISSQ